ncbi:unnamed protein product [Protopolystoma xenopodis]|uniref:Uncharacterized protein n=1 Tax=Protopolystoma xenopodis TaxID=117903 RepID=A0A3S5AQN7_9PLAT|nr:unnamed protein product [Protopolystoma xenopodis]
MQSCTFPSYRFPLHRLLLSPLSALWTQAHAHTPQHAHAHTHTPADTGRRAGFLSADPVDVPIARTNPQISPSFPLHPLAPPPPLPPSPHLSITPRSINRQTILTFRPPSRLIIVQLLVHRNRGTEFYGADLHGLSA